MESLVPVHFGAAGAVHFEVPGLRATDAWWPPGQHLQEHSHPLSGFLINLSGGFRADFSGMRRDCPAGTVLVEPAEIPHTNYIASPGARTLVIQLDIPNLQWVDDRTGLFSSVRLMRSQPIAHMADALVGEIHSRDLATPLAIEALVLEMLALALRSAPDPDGAPPWLERVYDLLHERFREEVTRAELASEAGVHPVYLSRAFRRRYRMSIPQCLRRLRLDWAAYRLVHGRDSIAAIAHDAGFGDQAHFTRAFHERHQLPPGRYRRNGRLAFGDRSRS